MADFFIDLSVTEEFGNGKSWLTAYDTSYPTMGRLRYWFSVLMQWEPHWRLEDR